MNRDNRNLLDALAVLRDIGEAPTGVTTTGFRISMLLPRERLVEAKRALHRAFVEQPAACVLDSEDARGEH